MHYNIKNRNTDHSKRFLFSRSRPRRFVAILRNMSFASTVVAGAFLGLRAIPTDVTDLRAVVAFGTLHAVTRQVSDTSAREARLLVEVVAVTVRVIVRAGTVAVAASCGFCTCTSDMALLATSVTLCAAASKIAGVVWAIAGDVTLLTTFVACFRFGLCRAIPRNVALKTAVVTGWGSGFWAASSLMANCAAIEASSRSRHVSYGSRGRRFRISDR